MKLSEKAKAVGKRYGWTKDTPPDDFAQQWEGSDSRKEIDREEQVGGNAGIQASIPINKIFMWIKEFGRRGRK